ncbi:MAG TPA: serine/threonine-protein kinase [Gemmatimonadales bacterium]|nr:serine/threonine-protein kinase [Gemmatimonadales bacterium]
MADPHLIGPLPPSTPPDLRISRGRPRALPADLLREASRRLGIMSLLAAALWLVGSLLDHLALRAMTHGDPRWLRPDADDAVAAVSVLLSLGLFAYTRKAERDPRFVLDLGLVYMVLTAAAIGLLIHWHPVPKDWHVSPMITWIGAVVLMFAAIVPSTPTKTLVAALIAVSMNPLGMLIARARGTWEFGSTSNVLLMHYPDYLLAGVAAVISYVVTGLGQQIARAREMGSYQLGELLGRGGMGEVYQATHRLLARPAAIKLIRPEMLGAGGGAAAQLAVKRFRREVEAAANLRSPHTVELYDFGVTEDQTLYFVMELLEGMDLESLVQRHGPVCAGRVIHILRQVCESLEEAHVRGMVHRDIKPANIHLGQVGLRYDFVKVLDFGLVKTVAGESAEHSLATAAGLTPGTPAYMAPEMALGESVDGRADLYALGCVAYYLLTGQVVFEAETPFQMVARHLRAEPVPPSRRTEAYVPPALEQLVLACLAKLPEDRPQSAAELGRSLAAIEVEPWGQEEAKQWWAAVAGRDQAASGRDV